MTTNATINLIRPARLDETPALTTLIAASVRGLSEGFYSSAQAEAALVHVFGVDSQLVADGTYYVVECESQLAACGGWSRRRTLYGGDQLKAGVDTLLNPLTEPARIRAFFVHPQFARRGIGRQLLAHCESAAIAAGFRRLEMMATLPGVPLYQACGYIPIEAVDVPMPDGFVLPCIRMGKDV
ncbi:MAG: GNAT family N-acetyltransferase [Blastocatellia bacterium]